MMRRNQLTGITLGMVVAVSGLTAQGIPVYADETVSEETGEVPAEVSDIVSMEDFERDIIREDNVSTVPNYADLEETADVAEQTEEVKEMVMAAANNDVAIDVANFPDEKFREYVKSRFDKDENGVLSEEERNSVTGIRCNDMGIASLKGLEYFKNLQFLECNDNKITSLDLSMQTQLIDLRCKGNSLTTLDLSKNADNFSVLDCSDNLLTSLDLSKQTKMHYIICSNNQLTILDISHINIGYGLECNNNQLTCIDVSNSPNLMLFGCDNNQLTILDISNNTELMFFACRNNQLKSLDVSKNSGLHEIECSGNQLTYLDLSNHPSLSMFSCDNNQLAGLNLDVLKDIYIDSFDVSPQTCTYVETADHQLDLSTIPGFDISKVSNLQGGTISGTILYAPSHQVSYTYDCDKKDRNKMDVTMTIQSRTEAFATRLYEKCLGREPEADGLKHWDTVLVNKDQSGAQVAQGFVFSQEYQQKKTSDEEYVEMLYNVFMDRASDAGGKAYWLEQLSNGVSREYVFHGFAESQEFTNICDSYNIERGTVTLSQARDKNPKLTAYVNRMYTKALSRQGEEGGLNDWCNRIQTGVMTPEQVAESFINSQEFKNKNLSNEEYIKVLYRSFMGREYDAAGLEHWKGKLAGGSTREEILHQFATSQEFKNIQSSFGL